MDGMGMRDRCDGGASPTPGGYILPVNASPQLKEQSAAAAFILFHLKALERLVLDSKGEVEMCQDT